MRRLRHLFVALAALAIPAAAYAAPAAPELDKADIAATQCRPDGASKLRVNVTYTLVNDYDSGYAGNAWANDAIHRQLRIWQRGTTYCAQVRDSGTFLTFAGASPSGMSTVQSGHNGRMSGGYVTTFFTGTWAPTYATSGNLGTFDLHCTSAYDCPGARPSYTSYFSSTSGDTLAQWGWIYKAEKKHGTWLNQDDTTAATGGDITG